MEDTKSLLECAFDDQSTADKIRTCRIDLSTVCDRRRYIDPDRAEVQPHARSPSSGCPSVTGLYLSVPSCSASAAFVAGLEAIFPISNCLFFFNSVVEYLLDQISSHFSFVSSFYAFRDRFASSVLSPFALLAGSPHTLASLCHYLSSSSPPLRTESFLPRVPLHTFHDVDPRLVYS